MEIILIFVVLAGAVYGWRRMSKSKRRKGVYLGGTGNADLNAISTPRGPAAPPRPMMTPPSDGGLSVAIQRENDAVWAWVLVTETTKQALAEVMKEQVDEYPLDRERAEMAFREFKLGIEEAYTSPPFSKSERELKIQDSLARMRKDLFIPRPILLRDFIAGPFRYPVSTAQDGVEYADRLKTKVFPKIKSLIAGQLKPTTESFEL